MNEQEKNYYRQGTGCRRLAVQPASAPSCRIYRAKPGKTEYAGFYKGGGRARRSA